LLLKLWDCLRNLLRSITSCIQQSKNKIQQTWMYLAMQWNYLNVRQFHKFIILVNLRNEFKQQALKKKIYYHEVWKCILLKFDKSFFRPAKI
jgi:disulfide oxidoreductase YuzD